MTTEYDVRAWPQFRQCSTHPGGKHIPDIPQYMLRQVQVFATVSIFSDRIVQWHEGATQVAALEKERRTDRRAHSSLWHRQECPRSVPQGLRSVRTLSFNSVPSCFSFNKIIIALLRKHELRNTASCLKGWYCWLVFRRFWDRIPTQKTVP